ncbi:hypothetical protein [Citrifermentans bremense]|uniref:hypothetical protein n=1 Tax=Citrifermentans bremense TaxID=60035 RepID=UPI00047BAE45|nr:hypothetical protein [Citrifermentans bremense]
MNTGAMYEGYARLTAFRNNCPKIGPFVDTSYIAEYHQIVDLLEEIGGKQLHNFRVPHSQMKPIIQGYDMDTETSRYSTERFCDSTFLLMKVEALLSFFAMVTNSSEKRPIGFAPR